MEGESCSLGGDKWRRDLMVDQRCLGILEASLMDSILDAARDLFISLFAIFISYSREANHCLYLSRI